VTAHRQVTGETSGAELPGQVAELFRAALEGHRQTNHVGLEATRAFRDVCRVAGRREGCQLGLVPRALERRSQVANRQVLFQLGPHQQHLHVTTSGSRHSARSIDR
jgi:hypothetical protein